jgi:hypothetical protein
MAWNASECLSERSVFRTQCVGLMVCENQPRDSASAADEYDPICPPPLRVPACAEHIGRGRMIQYRFNADAVSFESCCS